MALITATSGCIGPSDAAPSRFRVAAQQVADGVVLWVHQCRHERLILRLLHVGDEASMPERPLRAGEPGLPVYEGKVGFSGAGVARLTVTAGGVASDDVDEALNTLGPLSAGDELYLESWNVGSGPDSRGPNMEVTLTDEAPSSELRYPIDSRDPTDPAGFVDRAEWACE